MIPSQSSSITDLPTSPNDLLKLSQQHRQETAALNEQRLMEGYAASAHLTNNHGRSQAIDLDSIPNENILFEDEDLALVLDFRYQFPVLYVKTHVSNLYITLVDSIQDIVVRFSGSKEEPNYPRVTYVSVGTTQSEMGDHTIKGELVEKLIDLLYIKKGLLSLLTQYHTVYLHFLDDVSSKHGPKIEFFFEE